MTLHFRTKPLRLLASLLVAVPAVAWAGASPAPTSAPAPASAPDEITATPNATQVGRLPYRGGTDLEITKIAGRRYVVGGAQNNYNPTEDPGVRIVDVTNPAKPKVAGYLPCNTSQNDVQVKGSFVYLAVDFNQRAQKLEREDCFSQLGPDQPIAGGVVVISIANPRRPRAVGFVKVPGAAHNTTIHPSKPFLYVSDSETATNTEVHVVDVAKPSAPVLVRSTELSPGDAVHDISFNLTGDRAYVASSFTHTAIVDTTDPLAPKLISRIQDPAINFHHQAEPTRDGKFLIISDELAGAEGLLFCPGGGLHVYDLANEAMPRKIGAYYIPESFVETRDTNNGPRPVENDAFRPFRCTAHVMQMNPDGKRLTMAWYSQGIQVLDISNLTGVSAGAQGTAVPMGIQRIAAWKVRLGDAWSAKMDDRGIVYTGDTARGMDIVRVTQPTRAERAQIDPGSWLSPAESLARGLRDKAAAGPTTYFCFDRTYRAGLAT
ncbi:MAG TPA: hypothetical protein VNB94_02550 [Mycobacteriales bacterium]|nr:hypothetical protein [Mycobacteriales bacterium]